MKKLLLGLLIVMLVGSFFAGCKKAEEVAAPVEPVVFSFNNMTELQSLDPGNIEGVPEHRIYMALFEGLVSYDPATLDPTPGLAESWTISDDGLTYTFKLRKSNWSDGTPITAQTVVDSWLRFLSPELAAVYAYLPAMIIKGAAEYNSGDEIGRASCRERV